MAYKSTHTYVNLPVKDLNRTKEFFGSIGFEFNAQFSDEKSACMVINDNTLFSCLQNRISDVHQQAGGRCFRQLPQELSRSPPTAGACGRTGRQGAGRGRQAVQRPAADHGFMYVRSFEDLTGICGKLPIWI